MRRPGSFSEFSGSWSSVSRVVGGVAVRLKMVVGPVEEVRSMARYQTVLGGSDTVVVDFFASWCRPCDLILPKYEELASRFPATFIKVDIDEVPGVAQLANVRAMPTFHVYKCGKRIAEMVGADKYKLEEMIKRTV